MADSSLYLWHEDPTVEGRKELVRKLYGQELYVPRHYPGKAGVLRCWASERVQRRSAVP